MEIAADGVVFATHEARYRTMGKPVGEGGMGTAFLLAREDPSTGEVTAAVAKLFREELMAQIAQDPASRRHFDHHLDVLARVEQIDDLHVMPLYASSSVRDNHLLLSPFLGPPLIELLLADELSPRQRVGLVLQAARGLRTLHEHRIVHGDVTPNNILTGDPSARAAVVFDFDLSVVLDLIGGVSYLDHYEERVVGSPQYSIPPEMLDPVLVQRPVSFQRDIYSIGTALYGLFTDVPIYGDAPDLPSLLRRIAEGVVRHGVSRIEFPDDLPMAIRSVIVRCLERDPLDRYADTQELVRDLERAHHQMSAKGRSKYKATLTYGYGQKLLKLNDIFKGRRDDSVGIDEIRRAQTTLARHGYLLEMSLGRVKGHPIYTAAPDPVLLASGRFNEANTYRKIVTIIDLRGKPDPEAFVAEWLGRIKPILDKVRMAHLTALHRVAIDRESHELLLFSEYLDDPRFGTELARHELTLHEALGLGLIIVDQVQRLHEHGLAHNNVTFASLLFKGFPETGEAKPTFVGLVAPSFASDALAEDVHCLAGIVQSLLPTSRLDELPDDRRPSLEALAGNLDALATGSVTVPPIAGLRMLIEDGLTLIEDNFGVVRANGGDPVAFAHMMVRHSLYRRLWKSKP